MDRLEQRFLELQETNASLDRHIKLQRTLHDSHRRGCNANISALRDIIKRVEEQRDAAWHRIEELEKRLAEAVRKPNDDDADYVFEAHLEGMDCGQSHCRTCRGESATGAGS
jgi:chromosome segregation ATPase